MKQQKNVKLLQIKTNKNKKFLRNKFAKNIILKTKNFFCKISANTSCVKKIDKNVNRIYKIYIIKNSDMISILNSLFHLIFLIIYTHKKKRDQKNIRLKIIKKNTQLGAGDKQIKK